MNLRPSGSVISTKNFVWCGNQICEERDASNNVTKRFFAEGEQRIGGSDAGNYFYSRDHLGSIREVTDSTGALKAQYDYDAYGNSVVVSGNMNVDFGFTGHYFHQPSGMNLAMYRAYNPSLGRWISRDPLKGAETKQGPNLYAYVANDPINKKDRLGLYDMVPVYPPSGGVDYGAGIRCPTALLVGLWHLLAYDFWLSRHNDKYMHCLVSCRMSKIAGADCAEIVGDLQESYSSDPIDSAGDQRANKAGRDAATSCPKKSCEQACKDANYSP